MYETFRGDESGASKRTRKRRDKTILQIEYETCPNRNKNLLFLYLSSQDKNKEKKCDKSRSDLLDFGTAKLAAHLAKGVDIDGAIKLVDAIPQHLSWVNLHLFLLCLAMRFMEPTLILLGWGWTCMDN